MAQLVPEILLSDNYKITLFPKMLINHLLNNYFLKVPESVFKQSYQLRQASKQNFEEKSQKYRSNCEQGMESSVNVQ